MGKECSMVTVPWLHMVFIDITLGECPRITMDIQNNRALI
jgi:hypothetical protein